MAFLRPAKKPSDLDPISLALTLGLLSAFSIFILGIVSYFSGGFLLSVQIVADVYIGFSNTLIGAVVGAVWGFVDGFIGGLIFAYLYNFIKNKRP